MNAASSLQQPAIQLAPSYSMSQQLVAEALGTALLLAIVVGSGIMGETLASGNTAVALLANSIATGCGLYVLITLLGPVSGAHFNPLVSLLTVLNREMSLTQALAFIAAQIVGGLLGVAATHGMFDLPLFTASQHVRSGGAQWWAEGIASFGLLLVIVQGVRTQANGVVPIVPKLVACYITAAYWFTASTSFANPAVTIARATTNTFAGIRPDDAPGFIAAQFVGLLVAWLFTSRFFRPTLAR